MICLSLTDTLTWEMMQSKRDDTVSRNKSRLISLNSLKSSSRLEIDKFGYNPTKHLKSLVSSSRDF